MLGRKTNLNKEMASPSSDKNASRETSARDTAVEGSENEGDTSSPETEEEHQRNNNRGRTEEGDPPSPEDPKQDDKKEDETNKPSNGYKDDKDPTTTTAQSKPGLEHIFNSVVLLLGCAFVCLLVAVCISQPAEPEKKSDFNFVKVFGDGVDKLQSSFTNQTERFWKILKNRGLAHLRNNNPSQPLVFLLAAPPPAHEWVDCLAIKLAEKLDPGHKRNLARIDGAVERGHPPDKIKKKMDDYLKKKFQHNHMVAVIHHLELLPPPSPMLFYSYCDDQNAPHKHIAIIFTVHLPVEPNLSLPPKEAEGTVEKYLSKEVWLKDDMDAVAALLSRIADTVVLMNGESNDSLKAYCS